MDETQPYRRAGTAQAKPRRATARARRRPNWRRRLKLVALVLVAAMAAGVVLLTQRALSFNEAVSAQSALSMRLFGPFAGERVNVLLLGYSDETREGAFLSDSMNLLSIDRTTDTTTMIAIPRDLWVEGIPEVPQNMKINEALRIGYYAAGLENGAALAAEAVARVTGLTVDGWITLDFQGFEGMVDAVGGITIENPTAFAYTWDEGRWLAGNWEGSFDAGRLELNGAEALTYVRNRYTSVPAESSDFARLVRQQRVLQAIRAKVSGWQTIPRGLAVSGALEGHLQTNLSVWDLAMLAGNLDVDHRIELTEDVILQASVNSVGQYVLVVIGRTSATDYSPLHAYIADALANPPEASPNASPPGSS